MTASCRWYTEGMFSYVTCTSVNASHRLAPKVVVTTWYPSYTSDDVAIGTAQASIAYNFVNSQFPTQYQTGTFTITCPDDGRITDNG